MKKTKEELQKKYAILQEEYDKIHGNGLGHRSPEEIGTMAMLLSRMTTTLIEIQSREDRED